jgi:hypothetical protein
VSRPSGADTLNGMPAPQRLVAGLWGCRNSCGGWAGVRVYDPMSLTYPEISTLSRQSGQTVCTDPASCRHVLSLAGTNCRKLDKFTPQTRYTFPEGRRGDQDQPRSSAIEIGRAGARSLFRVTALALGVWRERYRLLRTRCGPELVSQDIKVPFEGIVPEYLRVCQQHFNCQ